MRKRYIHKQKYSECQLVCALNALIFFGKKVCNVGSKEYEELVDLVCARYGSAIQIRRAYKKLGLKYREGKLDLEWIKNNLPVAIIIRSKKVGWHQVLIIKVDRNICYTANFKEVRNKITFDDLKKIHCCLELKFKRYYLTPLFPQRRCISFRLKRR